MNILYVTGYGKEGSRFNGYALHKAFREMGHDSHMAVWESPFDEPEVHLLGQLHNRKLEKLNGIIYDIERKWSLFSILPTTCSHIYWMPWYRQAEIVHLQLIHTVSFFSLFNIPIIGRRKKLVWTLHDPWMLTGHCVHSLGCERWMTGCGECPNLNLQWPIKRDTTALTWKIKHWVTHHTEIQVVVASKWMYDQVKASPIFSQQPCVIIPLGVDTNVFKPKPGQKIRKRMGIDPDSFVISFRANDQESDYKGTQYVEKALARLKTDREITLITFQCKDTCKSLRGRYKFLDLGWINDPKLVSDVLNVSDLFLMPSIAEAFGMMAVEAMACGTPVVTFEGTAVPDVIHAPQGGLAVPMGDDVALSEAVKLLMNDKQLYDILSNNGPKIVREEYSIDKYIQSHFDLYQKLLHS